MWYFYYIFKLSYKHKFYCLYKLMIVLQCVKTITYLQLTRCTMYLLKILVPINLLQEVEQLIKSFFLLTLSTHQNIHKKSLRISNVTNYRKYIFAHFSVVSKLKLLYSKSLHSARGNMSPKSVCCAETALYK